MEALYGRFERGGQILERSLMGKGFWVGNTGIVSESVVVEVHLC